MEEGIGCGHDAFEPLFNPKPKVVWFWGIGIAVILAIVFMIILLTDSYGCISKAVVICYQETGTTEDVCHTFDYATYEVKHAGNIFNSRTIVVDRNNPSNFTSIPDYLGIAQKTEICLDP